MDQNSFLTKNQILATEMPKNPTTPQNDFFSTLGVFSESQRFQLTANLSKMTQLPYCIPTGQKTSAPDAVLAHAKRQHHRHFYYACTNFLHPLTKCTDEVHKSSQFVLPELCNRILSIARAKFIVVYFFTTFQKTGSRQKFGVGACSHPKGLRYPHTKFFTSSQFSSLYRISI